MLTPSRLTQAQDLSYIAPSHPLDATSSPQIVYRFFCLRRLSHFACVSQSCRRASPWRFSPSPPTAIFFLRDMTTCPRADSFYLPCQFPSAPAGRCYFYACAEGCSSNAVTRQDRFLLFLTSSHWNRSCFSFFLALSRPYPLVMPYSICLQRWRQSIARWMNTALALALLPVRSAWTPLSLSPFAQTCLSHLAIHPVHNGRLHRIMR